MKAGYHSQFFSQIALFQKRHFWFRCRNNLIVWSICNFFREAKNFLEVGCGTGFALSALETALPYLKLYGTDIYSEAISFAVERLKNCHFFISDAYRIPAYEGFDVIGAFDLFEHLEKDNEVIKQLYQALKRQGGLIITVPQHRWLWSEVDEAFCHFRRYEPQTLIRKVENAGFRVIYSSSFVSFLLPFMILARWKKRKKKNNNYDLTPYFALGKNTNAICEKIMDIERCFIQRGFSFPGGGSLLLVARKNNGDI